MRNFTLTLLALVFTAFVAQADELTICDGNAECQYSPFYGLKMDDGTAIFPLNETEASLPMATFTYETDENGEPIETCTRPECWYTFLTDWRGEAIVTITNNEEGSTVYYWIYREDDLIKKGSFVGDTYSFTVLGYASYSVVTIAKKEGMHDSPDGGVFFDIWDYYNIGPDPMRGDVNMDENVNMDDLTDLINYLLTDDATRISLTNADCDPSGKVNMDDLTALIDYLLTNQWPD